MIHDPPVEQDNGRTPETRDAVPHDGDTVTIYIDRNSFVVPRHALTGAMLRQLPSPPIRGDFDLFRVAVGEQDDVLGATPRWSSSRTALDSSPRRK